MSEQVKEDPMFVSKWPTFSGVWTTGPTDFIVDLKLHLLSYSAKLK